MILDVIVFPIQAIYIGNLGLDRGTGRQTSPKVSSANNRAASTLKWGFSALICFRIQVPNCAEVDVAILIRL